jgi:hypothetical protein
MGYTTDDSIVRVDFFKPSGKWYTTEAVKWTGFYNEGSLIHNEFAFSLRNHFKHSPHSLEDMDAICLEPYHQNAHPIMLKQGSWNDFKRFPKRTIEQFEE